jgi:Ca2+-binding RTX toxin-like protein
MKRLTVLAASAVLTVVLFATAAYAADIIWGTEQADTLYGTSAPDIIKALEGGDYIDGREGDDRLYGNRGLDQVRGRPGDDRLIGGLAEDRLYGGAGSDTIDSRDYVWIDEVYCSTGEDYVYADRIDIVSADCEFVKRLGSQPDTTSRRTASGTQGGTSSEQQAADEE